MPGPQDRLVRRNPAAPDEVMAEVTPIEPGFLDAWLDAAIASRTEWTSEAVGRSAALHQWADRIEREADALALLVCDEVGKPIGEARAEVARTAAIARYYAQVVFDSVGEQLPGPIPSAQVMVQRRPIGVVAAICPWNFPLAIPAWKIAPAIAYGNAVVFKPSSKALATGQRLVELARPGVPEQMLAFAPLAAAHSELLLDDRRIGAISFTGSEATGQQVISRVARRGGVVQAEMGGQNASIVLDDADVESSARTIAGAAMAYAGQKCTATSRVIVQRAIAPTFVACLRDIIGRMEPADPRQESTVVGPVIDAPAREAVEAAVADTVRRGGRLLEGGSRIDAPGWFVRPTLIEMSDPADPFMQEETFGPAAAVIACDSDEQAVALANGTRYGLAGAVFSTNIDRATAVASRLSAGMIRVNGSTTGADFWAPFGGDGASSFGPREQGRAAREFYTTTRTVTIYR